MICNKRELAAVFGVSEETLTRWAKLGCPVEETRRGTHGNRYDTAKVFAWRLAQAEHAGEPTDLENERTKLVRAQRELAELELEERAGKLLNRDAASKKYGELVFACRARLLLLPRVASGKLPIIAGRRAEAEAILTELVYQALEELARGDDERAAA